MAIETVSLPSQAMVRLPDLPDRSKLQLGRSPKKEKSMPLAFISLPPMAAAAPMQTADTVSPVTAMTASL